MAAIIPLDRATERFVRRAGQAGPDYEAGVRAPKRPWAESAAASEPNYEAGVQQGISAKRYGKGVRRAGNAKWQSRAVELGTSRFPSGVAAASADWAKGFQPFHAAISGATLPPRRPRRDPANRERINAILNAVIGAAQARDRSS